MSTSSTSTTGNGNMEQNKVKFECSVCLETLDSPASIYDDTKPPSTQNPGVPPNDDIPMPGPSRMATGGKRPRKAPPVTPNLTDLVTTACGHMYHKVCFNKWVATQRKRTCPSCRKPVPASKVIRLFPSTAEEPMPQLRREVMEPGPSITPAAILVNDIIPINPAAACDNQDCQDLKDIHHTLINDYTELSEQYENLSETSEIEQAQLESLVEDNERKNEIILQLRRELEESRGGRGGIASCSKRRRN